MPVVRPHTAVRATRTITTSSTQSTTASRSFSTTTSRTSSHGPQYDPPSGWLFGVKPGEKYQKEGWELPLYIGFFGTFAVATIAYAYKPDTSIQTWALEEARRRLEVEGILEDPGKKS